MLVGSWQSLEAGKASRQAFRIHADQKDPSWIEQRSRFDGRIECGEVYSGFTKAWAYPSRFTQHLREDLPRDHELMDAPQKPTQKE